MKENKLVELSTDFSVDIINLVKFLKSNHDGGGLIVKKLRSFAFLVHGLLNVFFLPWFIPMFIIWVFGILQSITFTNEILKWLIIFLPQILIALSCTIGIINGIHHFKRNIPAKICLILSTFGIVTTGILTVITLFS